MAARRVTARDVAREAGVSQATVSYVLADNRRQSIPERTRDRVREAAERLGYTPSPAARALRRGASDSVLVLTPDVPIGELLAEVLDGLSTALEPQGFYPLFRRSADDASAARAWRALMPAALVDMVPLNLGERSAAQAMGVAVVDTAGEVDDLGRDITQREIGRLQALHLLERGHTRLGYAATSDPRLARYQEPRLAGLLDACEGSGAPPAVVQTVDLDRAAAARAVARWSPPEVGVTGVVAYNDDVAFAVLAAARESGLRVPQDLALIGADDIPLAKFAVPALSSVAVRRDVVVGRIVSRVLRAVSLPSEARVSGDSSLEVVIRGSS